MSCGNLCPCQFNWPLDTHGFKKDAISSEKAWLDFAVRYLSREAAGKGNGQETVWSEECRPSWWDLTVKLPWKNPTTNPKDNKDILLRKYEALEEHLRKEGRFPSDLEEEAKLWADGKYKELFLLCHLTCLLRKVSGVHLAIEEACSKADKMKAQINQDVLKNIRNCLGSALRATEKFKQKESPKQLKRTLDDGSDVHAVHSKRLKFVHEMSKPLVPILPKPEQKAAIPNHTSNHAALVNLTHRATDSQTILKFANKLLEKRKSNNLKGNITLTENALKSHLKNTEESPEFHRDNSNSPDINFLVSSENSSPIVVFNHSPPVDVPKSTIDGVRDPTLSDLSVASQIAFEQSADLVNEIDFLLSPIPAGVDPKSNNTNDDCLSLLTALPSVNDKELISCGHEPLLEEGFKFAPSNPDNNVDDVSSGCNVLNPYGQGDPFAVVIESNNSSPHSIISETHSHPITNSDGGYSSAEDNLLFDLEEFMTDEVEHFGEKDPYGLERFLFDNIDNSSSGLSLIDQWNEENYSVTGS